MKKYFLLLFIFLIPVLTIAQDTTGSLAFKKNRPIRRSTMFYQPDLSYQIYQQFKLMQEANSGNPLAQHELGLRYLLGEDQPADTNKAVFWIRKAALQKLPAAAFNYGILLFNGWGTQWNPFEAYKNFLIAARDSMPQALYLVGVLHTDNLIVKRDWGKAYHYVKLASQKGYKPAFDVLDDIKNQLPADFDTTGSMKSYQTEFQGDSPGLVFIDFDRPATSLSTEVTDTLLFEDLLIAGNKDFENIITLVEGRPKLSFDTSDIKILEESALWGTPEALTLLGYLYESGKYYNVNKITAAAYYIRAARLESYRSKVLLFNLAKDQKFIDLMRSAAMQKDREAMFVWYGLLSFGLENSITENDALELLVKSAGSFYLPALVELGLLHYTGKYFVKDINNAFDLWSKAGRSGLKEADVRSAASVIYGEASGSITESVKIIKEAESKGSLLAQVALARAIEQEIFKTSHRDDDIKYYRNAAQRGSRYAFAQLQRKYNEIRPSEPEFTIN